MNNPTASSGVSPESTENAPQAAGNLTRKRFKWRRAFEHGEPIEPCASQIPVTVARADETANEAEEAPTASNGGAIPIELPGRATMGVETRSGVKRVWLRPGRGDRRDEAPAR
jgi:hypothetical protein